MVTNVNTNVGALAAVRILNNTNQSLDAMQNRVSTGLKISNAKDNGAGYAIAQKQRSEVSTIDSVKVGLGRATSAADVALAAGEAISDVLTQMRDKAVAATGVTISAESRAAYNNEFIALRDQITSIIQNASFDGMNLLAGVGMGGGPTDLTFPASADGIQVLSLPVPDFNLSTTPLALGSGPGMYLDVTTDLSDPILAAEAVQRINETMDYVNQDLARLGTAAKRIDTHISFITRLSDSITEGIGNIVDADLGQDSAQLQALQVRQQMSSQALNIANQAPNMLLSLLRT